jgi:16S rRNA G966 N2-methylase RsmD
MRKWSNSPETNTRRYDLNIPQLRQDRLDVVEKQRVNFFAWRGQFTPQFVDYILSSFVQPDDVVLDPFSGSGTVLAECAAKGISGHGYEINPAAYAMSKFFHLANLSHPQRAALFDALEKRLQSMIPPFAALPLFESVSGVHPPPPDLVELTEDLFSTLTDPKQRLLALNTLLIASTQKKGDLYTKVFDALAVLRRKAASLPYTPQPIQAHLCDARLVSRHGSVKADCILTSPPYINVFNYHQNYRAMLQAAGCDMLRVAKSELGANRKNRGNRFRTVVQYCLDMEQAILSFWACLKPRGAMILVVGRESNVRGVPFLNGAIIADLIGSVGGFDDVATYQRQFLNRFGTTIVEELLVTRKNGSKPAGDAAREIARNHLQSALHSATSEVADDIRDAISKVSSIAPSPLFTGEEIQLHV